MKQTDENAKNVIPDNIPSFIIFNHMSEWSHNFQKNRLSLIFHKKNIITLNEDD